MWIVASCATGHKAVSVSTTEPGAGLSLVPLDNPDGIGVTLPNPTTLSVERLRGKAIRISAQGKAPSYWFTPNETGRRVEIRVKQLSVCGNSNEANRNRPVRLVLKAYQALSANDYALARELAKKARDRFDTRRSYIITGLSFYNEGRNRTRGSRSIRRARSIPKIRTSISSRGWLSETDFS